MRPTLALLFVLSWAHVAAAQTSRPADDAVRDAVTSVMGPPDWNGRSAAVAVARLQGTADQLRPLLEPYWLNAAADPDRAASAYLLYLLATGREPPHRKRLAAVGHFRVTVVAVDNPTLADFRTAVRAQLPPGSATASWVGLTRGRPSALLAVDGVARFTRAVHALGDSHAMTVSNPPDLFTAAEYADFLRDRGKVPAADYAATFRALYDHLGQAYPAFQQKAIDWPHVGDELLPRADAVKTDRDFGLLVLELVAKLQDSHAVVEAGTVDVPDPGLPQWDPGFACLDDDRGRATVYSVVPDSPAARAGVRPGTSVAAVDGVPTDRLLADRARRLSTFYGYSSDRCLRYDAVRSFAAQPRRGAVVHLMLESPDGHPWAADVACDCGGRYVPRLPVPREGVGDSDDCSSTTLAPGVGYVYVRRTGPNLIPDLDAAVRNLGPIRGLVIDVRGNSGGGFDADAAFANFDPTETRWPDRPRYAGPVAVLTDARTISAGEGWTSWFVAHHRARLFGATTAGASSRKEEYALPDGRFKVVVPVKLYTGFLDRPIERDGLVPDEPVSCTAADLAAGRDTVVDAAVRWLAGQPRVAVGP